MIKDDDFGCSCESPDEFSLFRIVFVLEDLLIIEIIGRELCGLLKKLETSCIKCIAAYTLSSVQSLWWRGPDIAPSHPLTFSISFVMIEWTQFCFLIPALGSASG
jgi:hypothetical protein